MSRTTTVLLAMALTVPAWALAQVNTNPQAPQASDVAASLRDLERTWVDALVKGDTKTLGTILDATYMDTDELGHQSDKTALLAALKSGDLKIGEMRLAGMRIHLFGYTAVVTGKAHQVGMYKGKAMPSGVAFTDVFVMLEGQWKIVASQRTGMTAD